MAREGSLRLVPAFLGVAIITIAGVLLVWWMSARTVQINARLLDNEQTQRRLTALVAAMVDAEAGQRGYLLTGDERYLTPYEAAQVTIRQLLDELDATAQSGLLPAAQIAVIQQRADGKLRILNQTIELQRQGNGERAREIVREGTGRTLMVEIRDTIESLLREQRAVQASLQQWRNQASTAQAGTALGGALMMLLFLVWSFSRLRRDILQRQRVEEELEEGRRRLSGIVSSAMDAIISVDEQQKIVLFNKAAEKIFRCRAEDAIGGPLDRFIPERYRAVHREHVLRFGETGQTSRTMGVSTMALSGLRSDGEEFPIDASISQVRIGKQKLFTVILRDITERKKAEKALEEGRRQLEGIVASAMDAIISVDEQQKIVLFNKAAERIFGYRAEEVMGGPLDRLIPARFREAHRQHVRRFGATGQTTRAMGAGTMVLSGLRNNGEEFPIDASISQVQIGERRLFTVILRDITERRKAEEDLRRLYAELEQRVQDRTAELAAANQELEAFGYTVSHDLRAPLRHVTSFVDLLDKHAGASLDEKGRRYIRTISEAGRRMANLIDDLLMLSRLGRATLSQTSVSLQQLVDDARIQLAAEMVDRRIEWKIGELPEVCGDPVLLRNVVMNLLSNALKYTRGREPAVIEVGAREEDSQVICFVRDNGVGFDMRFVDKLFGVFQRLHRADEFEGTGVGLASVRRIIQRHGGRTWAEGEPDRGAAFYFSLPIRERCS